MSDITTCSTKIFTLAIAPFLFYFLFIPGVLCEFAMVPGVYIVHLSPKEEVMHSSS